MNALWDLRSVIPAQDRQVAFSLRRHWAAQFARRQQRVETIFAFDQRDGSTSRRLSGREFWRPPR